MADLDDRTAKKQALLEAIPLFPTLSEALALVELSSGTYHRWRQDDPAWAAQCEAAIAQREAGADTAPIAAPDPLQALEDLLVRFAALVRLVERLEQQQDTLREQAQTHDHPPPDDPLTAGVAAFRQALRTQRLFHHDVELWARRVQKRNTGPLTDLLAALTAPDPDAG